MMVDGDYEQARLELGIEDFEKEEVEVEEPKVDDKPTYRERLDALIAEGKETLEGSGIIEKIAKKVKT